MCIHLVIMSRLNKYQWLHGSCFCPSIKKTKSSQRQKILLACSPEEAGLEGKVAAMSIDWRSVRVVAEGTRLI